MHKAFVGPIKSHDWLIHIFSFHCNIMPFPPALCAVNVVLDKTCIGVTRLVKVSEINQLLKLKIRKHVTFVFCCSFANILACRRIVTVYLRICHVTWPQRLS